MLGQPAPRSRLRLAHPHQPHRRWRDSPKRTSPGHSSSHGSTSPLEPRTSRPPSLKRVRLAYRGMSNADADADADAPYLSGLVTPSDDYSLHELKLHKSMIFPARDGEDQILPVLTPMLPDLKVLDVRWEGSALNVRDLIDRSMHVPRRASGYPSLQARSYYPNNRSATVCSTFACAQVHPTYSRAHPTTSRSCGFLRPF